MTSSWNISSIINTNGTLIISDNHVQLKYEDNTLDEWDLLSFTTDYTISNNRISVIKHENMIKRRKY